MSGIGALLGFLLSCGVVVVMSRARLLRAPHVADRIAPYVPALRHRALPPPGPVPTLVEILRTVAPAVPRLPITSGAQALASAGLGCAGGLGLGLVAVGRGAGVGAVIVLALLGGALGVLIHDRREVLRARREREAIERQLPVIIDLLAFSVASGESMAEALTRVGRIASGVMAVQVVGVVDDLRAGALLEEALRAMAARAASTEVDRLVEAVTVALERGTPIVEVLRAQAADARGSQRRRLVELAGRKDIAMLVPVVFLILPTVIVIAIFPGFRALQVLVP